MSDILGKVMVLVLAFVLFILAPLTMLGVTQRAIAEREILNEVSLFADKVRDNASFTTADVTALSLQINSHGLVMNLQVTRQLKTVKSDGIVEYIPVAQSETFNRTFNKGDIVQVTATETLITPMTKMVNNLLGYNQAGFSVTLAAVHG
jgi:hypothetical protein